MKLSKKDAVLLHAVLYSFISSTLHLEFADDLDFSDLLRLKREFSEFLESDSEEEAEEDEVYDEDDADEDDEEEDEENSPEVDLVVSVETLESLPAVSVVDDTDSETSLEFESSRDSRDTIDVILDHGVVTNVPAVRVSSSTIEFWDPEKKSWRVCDLKGKFPKRWRKVLDLDMVYGVSEGEDESC